MNKARLLAWLRWLLVEPWDTWVCFGTVLFAVLFVWLCSWIDAESRSRWAGTALLLCGLVTTAVGIQQTRKQFGHPSIFAKVATWYGRRPKRNTTIHMGAGAMGVSGGSAILAVGRAAAPPGSSVEQRLQALEEWVPLIVQRSDAIERRLIDESTNRAQSDADERTARRAADDLIGYRLEASATGGLRLSAVGLTWLIFGTLFSGIPPEIASLIHSCPSHNL